MNSHVIRSVAAALLVGLVGAACTIEPSDLGETEERYLEEVETALRPLRESTARFDQLFQKTSSRSRFLSELKRVPAGSRFVRVFRSLDAMEPPPRFAADQRLLMRTIAELAPVLKTAEQLADQEEVVKSSARHAHVVVLYQRSLLEYTSRFCLVAATSAAERDLCDPLGILPGAAYGDKLHAILATASAEFTPRGFMFVAASFTSDDVAAYLRSIGPSLVDGVREGRDEIRKLVPPDEFAADQRVLEEYFTDITRVSDQIASAARTNPPRLRRLFPESRQIVNRANRALSEDIRPAVDVWFRPSTEPAS